jgi:hypothetical protein
VEPGGTEWNGFIPMSWDGSDPVPVQKKNRETEWFRFLFGSEIAQ